MPSPSVNASHIIVIGYTLSLDVINSRAGVLGLTTALRLLQDGFIRVTIVAEHLPADRDINYTSPWAGAHYRPIPDTDPITCHEMDLAMKAHETFKKIASTDVSSGVKLMDGVEYLENPSDAYLELKGRYSEIEGFRVLGSSELPPGVKFGATYKTFTINSPVYLAWLERQLILGGVKFIKRNLVSPLEAFSVAKDVDTRILINCSGIGFSDPNMFPTRGQIVLVANPCDRTFTQQNADGTWTFIIPRALNGGTVIGGSKEPNDWNPDPVMSTRNEILRRAAKMYPPIITNGRAPMDGGFEILADFVGRRPTRKGGVRIEQEEYEDKVNIHAYGIGGRGFETSWGVAEEVLHLVKDAVLYCS